MDGTFCSILQKQAIRLCLSEPLTTLSHPLKLTETHSDSSVDLLRTYVPMSSSIL